MLMWVPPGTSNHMLWHAGHALWVGDILTIEPITHRSELPAGWAATFGEGSQPGRISNWPEGLEVCELLEMQLARVQTLFADGASSIEVARLRNLANFRLAAAARDYSRMARRSATSGRDAFAG